jgi:hypothetical protein
MRGIALIVLAVRDQAVPVDETFYFFEIGIPASSFE